MRLMCTFQSLTLPLSFIPQSWLLLIYFHLNLKQIARLALLSWRYSTSWPFWWASFGPEALIMRSFDWRRDLGLPLGFSGLRTGMADFGCTLVTWIASLHLTVLPEPG